MNCSIASTSILPTSERVLRKKTASFDDSKRVNIHLKLSSARHNSLPEIIYRSTIAPSDQKPRRSTSSTTSKVTVEVSQKHISASSTPNFLKSSGHRVVVLKSGEVKKNLFIV